VKAATDKSTIPSRPVERHIYTIRGQKVMLDADLAALFRVPLLPHCPDDYVYMGMVLVGMQGHCVPVLELPFVLGCRYAAMSELGATTPN
jgi:hypothetical protein